MRAKRCRTCSEQGSYFRLKDLCITRLKACESSSRRRSTCGGPVPPQQTKSLHTAWAGGAGSGRKSDAHAHQRTDRCSSQFENNYVTEMCSGSEAGSSLRLIALCITQL